MQGTTLAWFQLSLDEREDIVSRTPDSMLHELSDRIGPNAGTVTGFARTSPIREEAKGRILSQYKGGSVSALDIGLGCDYPYITSLFDHVQIPFDRSLHKRYSYEVFEISDLFSRLGLDHTIDALEIDPLVVRLIGIQDGLLIYRTGKHPDKTFYRSFMEGAPRAEVLEEEIGMYMAMPHERLPDIAEAHLLSIPQDVKDRVVVRKGDIRTAEIGSPDVVFYNVVDIYLDNPQATLGKITDSMARGGFLFTTARDDIGRYGLVLREHIDLGRAVLACYQKG